MSQATLTQPPGATEQGQQAITGQQQASRAYSDIINSICQSSRVSFIKGTPDEVIIEATTDDEVTLYNQLQDLSKCPTICKIFEITIIKVNEKKFYLRFRLGNSTEMDPPTLYLNGDLTFTVNLDLKKISEDLYLYASYYDGHTKMFAMNHPVAIVLAQKIACVNDYFSNLDKILGDIDLDEFKKMPEEERKKIIGSYQEKISNNFKIFKKENFLLRYKEISNIAIDDLTFQLNTLAPNIMFMIDDEIKLNPKLFNDFVGVNVESILTDQLTKGFACSFREKTSIMKTIHQLFIDRNVSEYRNKIKSINIDAQKQAEFQKKADTIEEIAVIINSYYNILNMNNDDLIYSESLFVKDFIDHVQDAKEQLKAFPLECYKIDKTSKKVVRSTNESNIDLLSQFDEKHVTECVSRDIFFALNAFGVEDDFYPRDQNKSNEPSETEFICTCGYMKDKETTIGEFTMSKDPFETEASDNPFVTKLKQYTSILMKSIRKFARRHPIKS